MDQRKKHEENHEVGGWDRVQITWDLCVAVCDSITDFCQCYKLITADSNAKIKLGWTCLSIKWLPGLLIALNLVGNRQNLYLNIAETIGAILFYPLTLPFELCRIIFSCQERSLRSRLLQIVKGGFESPLQLILQVRKIH